MTQYQSNTQAIKSINLTISFDKTAKFGGHIPRIPGKLSDSKQVVYTDVVNVALWVIGHTKSHGQRWCAARRDDTR